MANETPVVYTVTAEEMNSIGNLVKQLPLGQGLLIWNLLVEIIKRNETSQKEPNKPKSK